MKLAARDVAAYFNQPDKDRLGVLIFGSDPMRVALKRQQLITKLVGPKGEEEMRLTRFPAADLRKDPALISDAIKAQGFFPGPRVVFVEDATDSLSKIIGPAMDDWAPGDAQLVITAGGLTAGSSLRKLFEKHQNTYAVGIYDNPPSRGEIEAELKNAGIGAVGGEAMDALISLANALDPGDFRQTIEKLSLYKLSDSAPVTPDDVEAIAPMTSEAAQDSLFHAVAEGQAAEVSLILAKLTAQGIAPVGICIGALRHFRALHSACSDPGGAASGIAKLRPPVHFKSRDRMVRQGQKWGLRKIEQALELLVETDLALRSTQKAPTLALVERALIRLSMLGRSR